MGKLRARNVPAAGQHSPWWHRRPRVTPPRLRRGGTRFPLILTFGVISLGLTVGLGAGLGVQLNSSIHQRSVDRLRQETQDDIAITTDMIATTNSGPSGATLTLAEERAQVRLMTSASQTLLRISDSVGVDVALPDGLVIAGAGAAPPGTMLATDPRFRSALAGSTASRILRRPDSRGASPVEQQLLRQHGDLLELQMGVRSSPGAPVTIVVRTYAAMAPSEQQADTDVVDMLRLLAVGLLVFWAVLFRLVVGASRRLERESNASAHLATHDTLTGLPNRVLFRDRVEQAIAGDPPQWGPGRGPAP